MFPEFGQSLLCLDLDLDSYEGSWTHVAAFRGRGGWLRAARATIQSEHDLLRATLLAACDDHENPIPAWRAEHLTACDWSNLSDCRELPPDLLDDLLCEEEGAFFARWHRETNADLARLHERGQADLAALDARTAAIQARASREIADLGRRRRQPDISPDHRAALSHLIADIEADSDAVAAEAAVRRAALRREVDAAEEALWERADVLIEVEPLWCIRWQAAEPRRARSSPRVSGHRVRIGGGKPVAPSGQVIASLIVEQPKPPRTIAVVPVPAPKRAPPTPAAPATAMPSFFADAELRRKLAGVERALHNPGRSTPVQRLRIQRAVLMEELRCRGEHSPDEITTPAGGAPSSGDGEFFPTPPATALASPPLPSIKEQLLVARENSAPYASAAPVDPLAAKHRERRVLQRQLEALTAAGERFRAGSPKFRQHQANLATLRQRIAVLGGLPGTPTRETLVEDRASFVAELAAHERRGAPASDGKQRLPIYAARRQDLLAKIDAVDRQLRALTPAPAPSPARPDAAAINPAVLEALASERAQIAADLDLHERSRVVAQNDSRARIRFNARQAELTARLVRADAKLAHARATVRTPA
jgi:hypothetical protein